MAGCMLWDSTVAWISMLKLALPCNVVSTAIHEHAHADMDIGTGWGNTRCRAACTNNFVFRQLKPEPYTAAHHNLVFRQSRPRLYTAADHNLVFERFKTLAQQRTIRLQPKRQARTTSRQDGFSPAYYNTGCSAPQTQQAAQHRPIGSHQHPDRPPAALSSQSAAFCV